MEPLESSAPSPAPTMRCPTCRAEQVWSDACRRCKCDLRLLHSVFTAYEAARIRCLRELQSRDIAAARSAAHECCRLNTTPESRQLLAVCALLQEDWESATQLAQLANS